jgi:retron-type reverse transcriptase
MRRHGGLWPELGSFANLHAAAVEALRGKRGRVYAGRFFRDLEANLLGLQQELLAGRYTPGAYRTFWIQDPKPRLISAAPFRDRVVHHALVRVIEPFFERRFVHHSYACRRGKGTHAALAQFVEWARGSRFVLKLDVRKFFPSIDHDLLKARLRRTLKDPTCSGSAT